MKMKVEKHFGHLVTFWFSTFVILFHTTIGHEALEYKLYIVGKAYKFTVFEIFWYYYSLPTLISSVVLLLLHTPFLSPLISPSHSSSMLEIELILCGRACIVVMVSNCGSSLDVLWPPYSFSSGYGCEILCREKS